jgi:glycosyltransferase involved in cell wall biosynthesis
MFPAADLHTLIFVPGATSPRIEKLNIIASPLSSLPGVKRYYRALLPLFPWAIERKELLDYDLVISTSHAVAKSVRVASSTPHLCYCFTPMRYVWDHVDTYLGRGLRRALATPIVSYLRRFDRRTSTPERVQRFVACSKTVAKRIERCYGRDARVVYPPVDVERFRPNGKPPEDFYLVVAGFVAYKREDLAIDAFRRLAGRRLIVAGDGPGRGRFAALAPHNVEFLGRVSDDELADLYARCKALIFPGDEDFGMIPVEAQAAGRPVIALGSGGALETVVGRGEGTNPSDATGIWFGPQTVDALTSAILEFESVEQGFDPQRIRTHALRFSIDQFRSGLEAEIERVLTTTSRTDANPE